MKKDMRKTCAAIGLALLACFAGSVPSVATSEPKSGGNAAVFRESVGVWERGPIELDKYVTEDYRGHTSSGDRDLNGLRKKIEDFRSKYSDIHFEVMDQVASGDRVASRLEASLTNSATKRPIRMMGMNISRFRDGKIAEEWVVWEFVRPTGVQ